MQQKQVTNYVFSSVREAKENMQMISKHLRWETYNICGAPFWPNDEWLLIMKQDFPPQLSCKNKMPNNCFLKKFENNT